MSRPESTKLNRLWRSSMPLTWLRWIPWSGLIERRRHMYDWLLTMMLQTLPTKLGLSKLWVQLANSKYKSFHYVLKKKKDSQKKSAFFLRQLLWDILPLTPQAKYLKQEAIGCRKWDPIPDRGEGKFWGDNEGTSKMALQEQTEGDRTWFMNAKLSKERDSSDSWWDLGYYSW